MGVAYKESIEFMVTGAVMYPPQAWEYTLDVNKLNEIDPKHIISYHLDGNVYSRYQDDIWYLTYSLNEKQWQMLDFTRLTSIEDCLLAKRLMFTIIYFSQGKEGTTKSPKSIYDFYGQVLYPMHKYSSKEGFPFRQLFESKEKMKRYVATVIKNHKNRATYHRLFLVFLKMLDENVSGVHYDYDDKHIQLLMKCAKEYRKGIKQTECIPPRILQNAQQMRWEHIDIAQKSLPKLIRLIERLMDEPLNYNLSKQWKKRAEVAGIENYTTFTQLVFELDLVDYCKRYKIKDRTSLIGYISRLTRTSRQLIYGYTGMRNDEGNLLLIGCYQEKGAGSHPVIIGIEKKNGIPVEHPFVTVQVIKRVIDIHETITKIIAKRRHLDEIYLPLMLNPQWIGNGNAKYLEAMSSPKDGELELDTSRLILTEEDMKLTLKATEPDRDWDNDKNYQVGKPWRFGNHQYRRSIAVYALNTGLVSLTALGKQYRHLLEATTAHYGNGHFTAQPLAGTNSKYHIKREMDDQREYYEGLAMFRDMMFNLERPVSRFAPNQDEFQDIHPEDQILCSETPDTIAKKIKNHEISYSNTAIGSCKSVKPCDGHIMLFFAGCVECDDAVVNDDKLQHTIQSTRDFKEILEENMPGSIELRDIEIDLLALVQLQQKRQGEKCE